MASELDATLASADVVVFSYGGCPYCRKVTRGFDAQGVKYREVDYDDMDEGEATQEEQALVKVSIDSDISMSGTSCYRHS